MASVEFPLVDLAKWGSGGTSQDCHEQLVCSGALSHENGDVTGAPR